MKSFRSKFSTLRQICTHIPRHLVAKLARKECRNFALPLLRRHEFRVGGECVHAMSPGVLRRRNQAASVG